MLTNIKSDEPVAESAFAKFGAWFLKRYSPPETIPISTQRRYLPNLRDRIWELDVLRGICVVLMMLDHYAMIIDEMFAPSWFNTYYWYSQGYGGAFVRFCHEWCGSPDWRIAHNIVLFVFFGISGISCTFSRSNQKRGVALAVVSVLYTLVTIFDERVLGITDSRVIFGVLHFLASCILIYTLVDLLCRHNFRSVSICSAGIVAIVLILYFCYTPPEDTPMFFAPLFPFRDFWGNPSPFYSAAEFSPGDLFNIIPYAAYFFFGAMVGPFLYGDRHSLLPKLDGKWNKPIAFVGRHALIFFILHIPALIGITALISFLFITPGSFGI